MSYAKAGDRPNECVCIERDGIEQTSLSVVYKIKLARTVYEVLHEVAEEDERGAEHEKAIEVRSRGDKGNALVREADGALILKEDYKSGQAPLSRANFANHFD